MPTLPERIAALTEKGWRHATTCRECYHPIFDEEGNPGYLSEACAEGAAILDAFHRLEHEYFHTLHGKETDL